VQIIYVGPGAGRTIASTDQYAETGVPIEVADDLAKRLLEQDVWQKPPSKPTPHKRAKKET
jgi:hypothetical protein